MGYSVELMLTSFSAKQNRFVSEEHAMAALRLSTGTSR